MKNLPEQDFWNAIRNRLLQYKEEPDDDWDKIAGAIPSSDRDYHGFSKMSDVVVLVLFAFLLGFFVRDRQIDQITSDKVAGKMILPEKQEQTVDETQTKRIVEKTSPITDPGERNKQNSRAEKPFDLAEHKNRFSTSERVKHADGTNVQNLPNADASPMREENSIVDKTEPGEAMMKIDALDEDKTPVKADSVLEIRNVASPAPKENRKTKKKFRPSVYFTASPTLGFYKVIPLKDDQVEVKNLERKGIFSGDRVGLNLEAGFQMAIAQNLELYASASYYQSEQTISYTYSDPTQVNITATNNALSYTLSPGESTADITFKQKDIGGGVGLMYHLRGRKLMHKIGGGLQLMQGLTRNQDAEGNLNPATRSLNYNVFYRLEYSILPRTSIFLQPSFTRSISANESLNAPFDVKPYHAGLGIGWLFHF